SGARAFPTLVAGFGQWKQLGRSVLGGRGTPFETRREQVEAEAARLVSLGATRLRTIVEEDLNH
ncbi:MAG: hypothetical protein ACR2FV_00805, partial [Ornithinimicrobium sp.]|uniref:hypothetical protein n=1 Tax=Ornithinimicrobium sp. TaxID=1977084 RepID=UPI003D9B91C6